VLTAQTMQTVSESFSIACWRRTSVAAWGSDRLCGCRSVSRNLFLGPVPGDPKWVVL